MFSICPGRWSGKLHWPTLKKILGIGVPNGLENSMFQLGKILVLSLVTQFGTAAIAANAVANNIAEFRRCPEPRWEMQF